MYIDLKTFETHNAGYHKKCYDKLVKKNTMDSWRESGRNHAIRLIRQVQQLSHTIEKK